MSQPYSHARTASDIQTSVLLGLPEQSLNPPPSPSLDSHGFSLVNGGPADAPARERWERKMGPNEVSYFLPSRAEGVNDMCVPPLPLSAVRWGSAGRDAREGRDGNRAGRGGHASRAPRPDRASNEMGPLPSFRPSFLADLCCPPLLACVVPAFLDRVVTLLTRPLTDALPAISLHSHCVPSLPI